MPEEGFLRRWARVKASAPEAVSQVPQPAPQPVPAPAPAAAPAPAPVHAEAPPAPTLEDAARLTPQSDFSAFVGQGVDKDVRRLALKKLFADPHFNVMDRLDMYMDDYNKPSPMSAAMLAGLQHARSALRRPEEVQEEIARLSALDAQAQAVPVPDEEAVLAAADDPATADPVPDNATPDDATHDEAMQDAESEDLAAGAPVADTSGVAQPPHAAAPGDAAIAPAAGRAHNAEAHL